MTNSNGSTKKAAGQWLGQWRHAALNGDVGAMRAIAIAATREGVVLATTGRICAYCDPAAPWGFSRCAMGGAS